MCVLEALYLSLSLSSKRFRSTENRMHFGDDGKTGHVFVLVEKRDLILRNA